MGAPSGTGYSPKGGATSSTVSPAKPSIPSAAFTPGPWDVGPSHVVRRQFRNEHNQRVTHWVAECCNQVGREREENEANARLIAAAPELYEAVRLFLAYDASDDAEGVQMMLDYNTALTAAKAAFAKARGEVA